MSQSHRQMLALRELRQMQADEAAELAARERAAEEERTRPLRDAQAEFEQTFREYYKIRRENLLTHPDEDFVADPDQPTWFETQDAAARYNKEQADLFVKNNPDYYPLPENMQVIAAYLEKNGYDRIVSAKTLESAFTRLREFGLLKDAVPEKEPDEVSEPIPVRPVAAVEPEPAKPAGEWGFNPDTGEPEFKSSYLIARMSAAEYKLFKRIPKDQLDLARLVRR